MTPTPGGWSRVFSIRAGMGWIGGSVKRSRHKTSRQEKSERQEAVLQLPLWTLRTCLCCEYVIILCKL